VLEQPPELWPVRRLRALAGVDEDLFDVVALAAAVLATGLFLGAEAQVLGLFGGRDAAVDDGAHCDVLFSDLDQHVQKQPNREILRTGQPKERGTFSAVTSAVFRNEVSNDLK
jgi:hypothetical protein